MLGAERHRAVTDELVEWWEDLAERGIGSQVVLVAVLAQRLLATMINTGSTAQQDAAAAVLRAINGPQADTRLQIILLEDELARAPADAEDDLLRLHHALADNYNTLGDYHKARQHGSQELPLRRRKVTTTPTPCAPATTSRPGPASAGTRPGRCACSRNCCPTGCACWALTTPTP